MNTNFDSIQPLRGQAATATNNALSPIFSIDIHAKQWFDKINGNSYFSARATITREDKSQQTYCIPFEYGYGDHYKDQMSRALENEGIVSPQHYSNGSSESIWNYCDREKILLHTSKTEK